MKKLSTPHVFLNENVDHIVWVAALQKAQDGCRSIMQLQLDNFDSFTKNIAKLQNQHLKDLAEA